MATYTVTFRYSDTALTLNQSSFLVFQKLVGGGTPTNPAPTSFAAVGYGIYKFDYTAAEDVVFVLDGGSTVPNLDRYVRGVLSPMDTRLDDSITSVTAALSNVNSNIQNVAIEVGNVYTQVISNNTTVNEVNNVVENITQAINQIETQTSSLTTIDNSVNYISNVVETINSAAATNQAAISSVALSVSSVNSNVLNLSASLQGLSGGGTALPQTSLRALNENIAQLDARVQMAIELLSLLNKMEFGKWKIETTGPDANHMIFFDEDGTTPIAKFALKDAFGNPTFRSAMEREPVSLD